MKFRYVALLLMVLLSGCASAPQATPIPTLPLPDGTREMIMTMPSRGTAVPITLVIPSARSEQALPLVVLIHGHGGTREEAGGFTQVAAQLARRGIASIRMDFPGCGDSTEPFSDNNLTNMRADARSAYEFAQRWANIDTQRVGLLGFSMGGRIAAELSNEDLRFAAMVIWAGAINDGASALVDMLGGPEAYTALKRRAEERGWAPYETPWGQSQQLGAQWFADLEASRPLLAIERYTGALLLIHGGADRVVPPVISRRASAAARRAAMVDLIEIENADHGFGLFSDQPQFYEPLIDETVGFFAEQL